MTNEPADASADPEERRIVRWFNEIIISDDELETLVKKHAWGVETLVGRWYDHGVVPVQLLKGAENRDIPIQRIYIGQRNPVLTADESSKWLWYFICCRITESSKQIEKYIVELFSKLRQDTALSNGGAFGKKKG